MTEEQMRNLQSGDMVKSKASGDAYVISQSLGAQGHIGVRTTWVSNPQEWDLKIDSGRMCRALNEIARQRLEFEMPEDEREDADYRGAYDALVRIARAATRHLR
jgi:hypothetical protein